jgi:tRNA A37 threonylcarbamoyladenosine modification protein TsaB
MKLPPILSLDLASACGSAAIWADGRIIATASRLVDPKAGFSHAALWRQLLTESLASSGLDRSALGLLAVTVGPGSFTGIRVSVAAMRGLGIGLGLDVWGESSFATAAEAERAAADEAAALHAEVERLKREEDMELDSEAGPAAAPPALPAGLAAALGKAAAAGLPPDLLQELAAEALGALGEEGAGAARSARVPGALAC